MNAIEFTATPHAGVIAIPKEYLDEIEGEGRVIVLKEDGKKAGRELQTDLEEVFEKYKGVTPFQNLYPVEWQKEQRHYVG